jgi:hypothetical protein
MHMRQMWSEATCEIVALELLYSARSVPDYEQRLADLQALPWLPVTQAVMTRALGIQRLLAARGQHLAAHPGSGHRGGGGRTRRVGPALRPRLRPHSRGHGSTHAMDHPAGDRQRPALTTQR